VSSVAPLQLNFCSCFGTSHFNLRPMRFYKQQIFEPAQSENACSFCGGFSNDPRDLHRSICRPLRSHCFSDDRAAGRRALLRIKIILSGVQGIELEFLIARHSILSPRPDFQPERWLLGRSVPPPRRQKPAGVTGAPWERLWLRLVLPGTAPAYPSQTRGPSPPLN
jgi:hypothetical protein